MSMRSDGPVLVGFEPSRAGLAALDLAVDAALGRGLHLVVLHSATDPQRGHEILASARARARARARVRAGRAPVMIRTEWTSEEPAAALLRHGRESALLVVGHHGRRGARSGRTMAGSVALRVATHAAIPVIVHRPAEGCMAGEPTVTVGVGGIPDDEPLAFAFAEADRLGVPLVVEHVWSCAADSASANAGGDRRVEVAAFAEAVRLLDDTVAVWSDKFPDVRVRRALRHGLDPAFALTAASRSARLLVVGSTAPAVPLIEALVHRARCPVAVVPCGRPS